MLKNLLVSPATSSVPLRRISVTKPDKVFTETEIRRFSEPVLKSHGM